MPRICSAHTGSADAYVAAASILSARSGEDGNARMNWAFAYHEWTLASVTCSPADVPNLSANALDALKHFEVPK